MQSKLRKKKQSWQLWITLQIQECNKAMDVKVSLFTSSTKPMLSNCVIHFNSGNMKPQDQCVTKWLLFKLRNQVHRRDPTLSSKHYMSLNASWLPHSLLSLSLSSNRTVSELSFKWEKQHLISTPTLGSALRPSLSPLRAFQRQTRQWGRAAAAMTRLSWTHTNTKPSQLLLFWREVS